MFLEELRAGREHDLVRRELPVTLNGDRDVSVRAELRRKKGERCGMSGVEIAKPFTSAIRDDAPLAQCVKHSILDSRTMFTATKIPQYNKRE